MGDIILSIAAKIAEYAQGVILHHARYLCCFNYFAESLSTAKEDLELTRGSINLRDQEATDRLEKIEPPVEKWLNDVQKVLDEVQQLEGRISEARESYFRRRCQYSLAKEMERITKEMTQLNQNSKFEPFSRIIELPGMQYYSSKDFVFFESTKSAYKKLLKKLNDKSVVMIGLVGMGGSGKTTLVKEVGKKVEELKLFEKVVIATVSQTPDIRSIQAQVADQIHVKLEEESDEGRARRLSQGLKNGRTLLILDDVWEIINFEAVGIPFNENKGCVVLLTSRERKVCNTMLGHSQSIVELNLLTGEEAWSLFTSYANINDDTPVALKLVAGKIVNECKGLPIAIVAVGSTLKNKTLEEWELALSRLEDSKPLDVPKGLTSPHVCLKLSYDNLTNQLAKSFLLLCSIFPEDHEIDLEDLFRFGKGWCLSGTFGMMEKARREMHAAVNILRDSCLLVDAKNKKVKMHDMVRDVALWIASERGPAILASTVMDPRILVEDEIIIDKRVISLWGLHDGQLPVDQLNCSSLEILLLHSPWVGFEVSNACLERLKKLKILTFITCDYSWELSRYWPSHTLSLSLPQSNELLRNLHTLCLRRYKLGDISILERLEALEILDLRGSSFEELPNGIVALKKLKLLDLYNCWIVKNNAVKVIGRCMQLEELYLCLLQSKEAFPHNVSFPRLQRYVIIQNLESPGDCHSISHLLEKHRPFRALCLEGFNAFAQSFTSLPIKDLFLKVEYLHLKHLEGGYKDVIPSMYPQGLNQLIVLVLEYCGEIECLTDSSVTNVDMLQPEAVFTSLATLWLDGLDSLKEVFPRNSKLCSLKELRIYDCPKLTCIFMPSIAQTLVLLESLKVHGCSELKNVIEEGDVDEYVSSQSHTSLMLPKLSYLDIRECDKLEYIFPICFARGLVSLETLIVRRNREMKYVIKGDVDEYTSLMFPKLKSIEIQDCDKMKYIFPICIARGLVSLERLIVENSREMKYVIEEGDVDEYVSSQSHTSLMLQKLRHLEIQYCDKLEYIFPTCIARGLVSLEWLIVRRNREMKYVFGSEKEQQNQHQTNIDLHLLNLDSLSLKSLPNLVAIWPDYCYPRFPKLRFLECLECQTFTNFLVRTVGIDSDIQQDVTAMEKEILWAVAAKSNQLCDQMFSLQLNEFLNIVELELYDVGVKGVFQIGEPISNTQFVPFNLHLSSLSLENLPELNFIWKGPTNFLCLQMLRSIYVSECPKLTTIFSSTIVRSLPMLSELRIFYCEELEQIFELKSLYTCSQQVCFPQLKIITVENCNKLKCLFYNFEAGHFPSLVSLTIKVCSQLERVFAFELEADDDGQEGTGKDGQQVLLQNLEFISLSSVPNFREIHHGFELRDHVKQTINDCPKYSPEISSNTQSAAHDSGSA